MLEFLNAEKKQLVNTEKRLCSVYGSCAIYRSTAGHGDQRVKATKSSDMELYDLPHSGHLAISK